MAHAFQMAGRDLDGARLTALPLEGLGPLTRVKDFVGAFCRATLKSVDLTLSADFSPNLIRDLGVEPGRRLDVALPPDRVRVFAA